MADRKRNRRDEIDALLEGALTEEVFPNTASDEPPVGEWPDWLDPIVKTVLDETRGAPEGPIATLATAARAFGLAPEIVLADAIAREVRHEMARSGGGKRKAEASHVDAGLWSALQLVNAYLRASEAAAEARERGRDASISAAFDVLSTFSMPERLESPELDLSGPFDACVRHANRIYEAQSVPRKGRFSHTSLALELARQQGCLVPPGTPAAVIEKLRAAGRRYEASARVDLWVSIEEHVRALLRKKEKAAAAAS